MSSRSSPDTLPASPELLRQFAATADQRAFEIIVQRHAAWMEATAGRLTADSALAQEVVQDAFALLARKQPHLPTEAAMGAWLHRTVLFLMRNQLAKLRRRQRKYLAYTHQETACPETAPEALGHLDTLIETLPETDRELIIGRYFNELPWAALATIHGASPEAVRKRTERILQRLAAGLQGHGAHLSTIGLIMFLTDQAKASHGLPQASAITAGSPAGGGSFSPLTIFNHTLAMMNTSKLIVVTAALCTALFSIPLGVLSHRNQIMENRVAFDRAERDKERNHPIISPTKELGQK